MKTILGLSLLTATLLLADAPVDPARQLYDTGIQQTQEGKYDAARQTLQSLVKSYPTDPLALQAKGAIDATLLFEEGQSRAKAGKYETARVAFETLIAVYPENPLADRAKTALQAVIQKEKKGRTVVGAMEFRDVPVLPAAEIREALEQREVRLCVGSPYRSQDIDQAKTALEEILSEKGMGNVRVQTQTRPIEPNTVDVIFTVEKMRGSLLGSPWRLAVAGWRHVRPAADPQDSGI